MGITCGIDQSYTSTALVILKDDNLIDFKIIKTDNTDDIYYRCFNIIISSHLFLDYYKPEIINIEGLSFGSRGDAVRQLGGLQFGLVCKLKYEHGYNVYIIPPMTLKKFASGNGRADKNMMINSLPINIITKFKEYGYKKSTGLTDLADAYFLAKFKK